MTTSEDLTADRIRSMSYNELIGLVRETNRPPGGEKTLAEIALRTFLRPGKEVLEIGTSTGISAIELALLSGAHITAIDINQESLTEARQRAQVACVQNLISFEKVDATKLPYPDATFDVVFCGNVTSLVSNREAALAEYARVLKEGGFLAAVPMYYIREPSETLVKQVSAAIQVTIKPQFRKDWMEFFVCKPFVVQEEIDFVFDLVDKDHVQTFCTQIIERPHLQMLSVPAKKALADTYSSYMQLFRENLSRMGFTILLLRKRTGEFDEELFTSHKIITTQ